MLMTLFYLVTGIILLAFGYRVFWLLIGAIGFVAGMTLATWLFPDAPQSVALIAAVGAGLLGAVIALFMQKIAVVVGGFLAGGYFVLQLAERTGWAVPQMPWLPFVVGGVVGALIVSLLFRWAIIVLSSFTGALLIVHALGATSPWNAALTVILLIAGIFLQTKGSRSPGHKAEEKES
jgi:hypothetical protein